MGRHVISSKCGLEIGIDRVCHLTKSWVPRRMKGRESESKGESGSSVTDGLSHKLEILWAQMMMIQTVNQES